MVVRRRTASTWQTANSVRRYDGTEWKDTQFIKVWDGTQWVSRHTYPTAQPAASITVATSTEREYAFVVTDNPARNTGNENLRYKVWYSYASSTGNNTGVLYENATTLSSPEEFFWSTGLPANARMEVNVEITNVLSGITQTYQYVNQIGNPI